MFERIRKSKLAILYHSIISILLIGFLYYCEAYSDNEVLTSPYFKTLLVFFIIAMSYINFILSIQKTETGIKSNYIKIINTLGADISEAYSFGEIGIIVYNEDKEVIWTSNLFEERNIKLIGSKIFERYPSLEGFFKDNPVNNVEIEIYNRQYSVIHLKELSVLIFKDISDIEHMHKIREEESPVIFTIMFDDLANLSSLSTDDGYLVTENQIRSIILDWAKTYNVLLVKVRDDVYYGLLNERIFNEIKESKFKLSEKINELNKDKDYKITVSTGIGRGVNDFNKLSELSSEAIEISQSRGGNQTVIKNYSGHLEFFGGDQNDIKHVKNNIRGKQKTNSFFSIVKGIKNVILVPHENADFDAIGACLGLTDICKAQGCNVYLGAEEKQIEVKARIMLKDLIEKDNKGEFLISEKKALSLLSPSTLVITVDCNNHNIVTYKKLVAETENIGIIDHHRKGENAIDHAIYNYIDPSASSTCEMITNMIEEFPFQLNVSSFTATYLLTGILLDTNNFKDKTTSNTFGAAVVLKELGADNELANSYLKEEYEEFELKTKIMSTMESPFFGVMIATSEEDEIVDRTILAKVAQDMLDVKGIQTSFVIGSVSKKDSYISARSDGNTNVQLIMEKLGGGGHFSSSACLLENRTIKQAKEELISILEIYLSESKQ